MEARHFLPVAIGKVMLMATFLCDSLLWEAVGATTPCRVSGAYILLVLITLVTVTGLGGMVMTRLQPRQTSALVLHGYTIMCAFAVMECVFFGLAYAFTLIDLDAPGCPEQPHPDPFILTAIFLLIGSVAVIGEIVSLGMYVKALRLYTAPVECTGPVVSYATDPPDNDDGKISQ